MQGNAGEGVVANRFPCSRFQNVSPCDNSAVMTAKQLMSHPRSVKSRAGGGGRELARSPTRAGGVTRQEAHQGSVGQDQGLNCESVVLLKNLAKLLVDRIEAACAAKKISQVGNSARNVSQVANPNKALISTGADHSRLVHRTGSGISDPSDVSVRRGEEDHHAGISCPSSHENGSSVDGVGDEHGSSGDVGDEPSSAVPEEKANPPALITTQKQNGHLGSPDITERNRRVRGGDDDARRGGRHDLGGSNYRREAFGPDSRRSLRSPAREWSSSPGPRSRSANVIASSRMQLPQKKGNEVALEEEVDCGGAVAPPPTKGDVVRPTGGRLKIRSPGLRSLVVPQVKGATVPPPGMQANTKLVLRSSTPNVRKHTAEAKRRKEPVSSLQAGGGGGVGSLQLEELYKTVWADVVQDVFDEVFSGDEAPPPRRTAAANSRKPQAPSSSSTHQLPSVPTQPPPPRAPEAWVIQMQSIKRHFRTPERAASRRSRVHKTAKVENLKTPKEEPTSTQAECSSTILATEGVSCKPPVILPTLAKYHMDKRERTKKKDVAEKELLRDSRRCQPPPPTPGPDPYNVLNVYAERCAPQHRSRSTVARRSEADAIREVDNPT